MTLNSDAAHFMATSLVQPIAAAPQVLARPVDLGGAGILPDAVGVDRGGAWVEDLRVFEIA